MSKRIVHELTYDAPVSAVAAMMRDPQFRKDVCAEMDVRVEVTVKEDGEDAEIVLDQWQPTAGIPSFAKKFVGDETNVIQAESWTGPDHGDVVVTIPGKPGDMTGTAVLTESDGVTTETVDMTIKVGIPLVGGKIETLIGDMLKQALDVENRVGRAYLSR